jgi:hypothetical protein
MPAAPWREEQGSLRLALLLGLLLAAPAIVLAERLPIKTYTVADGLAHNHVTRIYRDSRGFLWFATFDGLSRFDGHRFTSYGREHGLPHADVSDILEDRQRGYWLATYGGGAINADGLASPTPATVSFAILPPIWQRWWFLALLAMLSASVIYWLHRFRVTRLVELERVRTRIATDLHDDVGSSLSQIAILSEVARRQVEQGTHAQPISFH